MLTMKIKKHYLSQLSMTLALVFNEYLPKHKPPLLLPSLKPLRFGTASDTCFVIL